MKVEITEPLVLTNSQSTLLEMHSFLNVINVLISSLQVAELLIDRPGALADAQAICESIRDGLGDEKPALEAAQHIEMYRTGILAALQRVRGESSLSDDDRLEYEAVMENVINVFDILRVRVREILARFGHQELWVAHQIETIRENLLAVVQAIEKNSNKRYHIVHDPALQGRDDYLLTVEIHSVDKPLIIFPPVFQDVMRDLTANARKYTLPGGRISVVLEDNGEVLTLTVSDDGCGIPADELPRVVNFGCRATNVASIKTHGGGFGLTKAYFVARQFGGRMWIDSVLNEGTEITIAIPWPRPDQPTAGA